MGEMELPTAADYAQSAAQSAQTSADELSLRVETLEAVLRILGHGELLDQMIGHEALRRQERRRRGGH